MPPSSSSIRETNDWVRKADSDLATAKLIFAAKHLAEWHQVLFHCQQSVEKMMKALLTFHEEKFRRTHDLVELGTQCEEKEPSLAESIAAVAELSDYAWEFRYPGEMDEPSEDQAKLALALAEKFSADAKSLLPTEAAAATKSI